MRKGTRGKGRGEASALLALGLLLLVLVSSYTLLAYRSALEQLVEARRGEAEAAALHVADELRAGTAPKPSDLRRWAPQARAVTLFDEVGRVVVAGRLDREAAAAPGRPFSAATLMGTARFVKGSRAYVVQVDLDAPLLRARSRTLRFMVPWLLAVDVGVVLLVLIYARRRLRPWEKIMDRAARLQPEGVDGDEIDSLVETFERALQALSQSAPSQPERRELETLQEVLGRSLESGVLVCDVDGRVLALNEVGAAMLTLPGRPEGRDVEEVLQSFPELLVVIKPAFGAAEAVQRAECAVETADGEKILGVTAHPLRRDDGGLRGFLILFADLTEIKRRLAAERLSESLRQLGELTAGVAHEMRNGLATLKGYLTLIAEADEGESVDDYVLELRRETESLHRILEEFLTFARPGGGRSETLDLEAVLHRAAGDPSLEGPIKVEIDEAGNRQVIGDRQLLLKALLNLLLNAEQAQAALGVTEPIRLRLSTDAKEHVIEVLDRGRGVPAELEAKLFEPFVTGRTEGVGLGLALARRIALLHGGEVALDNRKGGGARAVLRLPVDKNVT